MLKIKKIIPFLCILAIISGLIGCKKSDGGLKKITVCEVTHSVFYAPQYLALELGLFENEGLEIELTTGQGADAVTASVLSGDVDIGFAGPEAAIYVYNEGRENYLKVFAQMTKCDGSFLISRKKQDNFKWSDLKGAHILPGRKGGVPYMTFEYILKQNGIDVKSDVNLDTSVQFAMMTGAFVSGTGDYTTAFEPTASTLEESGKGYIVASVGEASGEIPYTAYFASKEYIEKNSDTVSAFVRAIEKAQKWCKEHSSKEIAEKILPDFPDISADLLEKSIERYKSIGAYCEQPKMSRESFEKLQDVMESAGELKARAEFEKIVDNSFAKSTK